MILVQLIMLVNESWSEWVGTEPTFMVGSPAVLTNVVRRTKR